jgi:hypothetical protein
MYRRTSIRLLPLLFMTKTCRHIRILLSLAIFSAVSLGGALREGVGAELVLVHVGYGGIAGYQLPLWVSKEAGISKKYGVELEPLLIGGGALNMQALLAGSIQLSQNSASAGDSSGIAWCADCSDCRFGKSDALSDRLPSRNQNSSTADR